VHGDTAQDVSVDFREAPKADEQIDHAGGCVTGGAQRVCVGFDDNPGIGCDGTRLGGFDERAGDRVAGMQVKAQSGIEGAFDAVDADLAVSLGSVAVSAGKKRAGAEDREIEACAGRELADIHIAAERAGWTGAEFALDPGGDAHHPAKRTKRHDSWCQRARFVRKEVPMEKVRLTETILEKAEAFHDGGISPAVMGQVEDFDFEDIAWFRAANQDRAGEGVDAATIDAGKFVERDAGMDLPPGGFEALEMDNVAGVDFEARRKSAIPARVGGGGIEWVFRHRTETTIWSSTMAWRGRAVTPMAARAWRPASPKTWTSRSEAPLITWGESGKPATVLT